MFKVALLISALLCAEARGSQTVDHRNRVVTDAEIAEFVTRYAAPKPSLTSTCADIMLGRSAPPSQTGQVSSLGCGVVFT